MKNYSFANKAIVRTPLEPKKMNITWEMIQDIFKNPKNREALFIGSPSIYKAFELWEKGEAFQEESDLRNLKGSLYKYTSRMSNRCTPFGMFAHVSAIDMGSETKINFEKAAISRYTKYDMYFLGSFMPIITKDNAIRSVLQYFPNTSVYTVFDKYRYVEYYFKKNARLHKISEVLATEYLDIILKNAANGTTISELTQYLISDEITEKDALAFINTIIDSQFLVSELEFTLTGEDYFEKLIAKFSEDRFNFHEAQVIRELIVSLKDKIRSLDENVYNDPEKYQEIYSLLNQELDEVDESKLFQVDGYRTLPDASLSNRILKKLRNGVTALNKLQPLHEKSNLKEFKRKFSERYEEYEQPLIKVLDPDVGIGYGKQSGAKTPLVDELNIIPNFSNYKQVNISPERAFLFRKLVQSTQTGATAIALTDDEINQFEEKERLYTDSFSVFFNMFHENNEEKIALTSVAGPSANGLIGRFGHLNENIMALCDEISEREKALHPDKIIAEIIHLPQARTGNILYRGFQREYEIPYLGSSSLDLEHQISVDDLYVSVKNNRIVLRSKRLNKEIIPRLGNAHNYSANALPIYHFLCDLQNQDSSGIGFSWGELQNDFDFLPRLSYNDILLSRATWNLSEKDIKFLTSLKEEAIIDTVRAFQSERKIPDIVAFVQGDNEVVVNFTNDLSCKVFTLMLKGERFIQLKEFLFKEDTVTENYCNEFIVSAFRNVEVKKETNNKHTEVVSAYKAKSLQEGTPVHNSAVTPSFSIGEEWLYYKFYCGERAGEELLNRAINPIVAELEARNLIQKWFFIRYQDALGHHLRFRVLLNDKQHFTECINIIKQHIQPFEKNNIIWKTQTDTYLRELQRYGHLAIAETESLFHFDSECTLRFSDMIEGDQGEKIRWKFCLLSMHFLLEDLGFSLKDRIEMLKVAKTSFGNEFNRSGSGELNKQINEMFAKNERDIELFMDESLTDEMYAPIWDVLKERSVKNSTVAKHLQELAQTQQLPTSFGSIALSYLHMICNRVFIAKQRVHEMVVYDYLYRYYSKQLYTSKAKAESKQVEIL
ncbi:lantibiotic dehydratase [Flavobacterium cerinum]|uniref:Lantibiotic dehydratase n=1 Tax=Flavobacterium cerinum TaxID=2502784 RepID=A0ABY5IVJ9_9FLAO|nr:lantibiotic dehydratase [Flavobacterium cerinum]UUC46177.1 lantibiotic dehydratase [Flavobacterium cerinum]